MAEPTMDEIRDAWVDHQLDHLPRQQGVQMVPQEQARFDAALAAHEAEVRRDERERVESDIRGARIAWDERPDVLDAIEDALLHEPRSDLSTEQRVFGAGYGTGINDAARIARAAQEGSDG